MAFELKHAKFGDEHNCSGCNRKVPVDTIFMRGEIGQICEVCVGECMRLLHAAGRRPCPDPLCLQRDHGLDKQPISSMLSPGTDLTATPIGSLLNAYAILARRAEQMAALKRKYEQKIKEEEERLAGHEQRRDAAVSAVTGSQNHIALIKEELAGKLQQLEEGAEQ